MVVCKSFVIALFYCYEYHCVTRPICITSMERDTHRVNSDDNSSGPHRRNMEFSWSHHISSSSLTYRRVLSLECEATKTQLNYPTDFCSTPSIYVIEWQRKGGCQRPTRRKREDDKNPTPRHPSITRKWYRFCCPQRNRTSPLGYRTAESTPFLMPC